MTRSDVQTPVLALVAAWCGLLMGGGSAFAADAPGGGFPEVFTRPGTDQRPSFKEFLGSDAFAYETASRIIQNPFPDFLDHGETDCSQLLHRRDNDFYRLIHRLKYGRMQAFAAEWANRLEQVLSKPQDLALRRGLEIDVSLPSYEIAFVDDPMKFEIPLVMRGTTIWRGFGSPLLLADQPETDEASWRNFRRVLEGPPMFSENGDRPLGNGEPDLFEDPERYVAHVILRSETYAAFIQLNPDPRRWRARETVDFLVAVGAYFKAILDLGESATRFPDPDEARRYRAMAKGFAQTALSKLPAGFRNTPADPMSTGLRGNYLEALLVYRELLEKIKVIAGMGGG